MRRIARRDLPHRKLAQRARTRSLTRREDGEVASWLILSAGLAFAATIAVALLSGTVSGLADEVGVDAGVAGDVGNNPGGAPTGTAPGGPPGNIPGNGGTIPTNPTGTAPGGPPGDTPGGINAPGGPPGNIPGNGGTIPTNPTGTAPGGTPGDTPGSPSGSNNGEPTNPGTGTTNPSSGDDGRGGPGGRGDDSDLPVVETDPTVRVNGVDFTIGPYVPPTIQHDNGFLQNPDDPNDPNPIPTRQPTDEEIEYYLSEVLKTDLANTARHTPIIGRFRDEFNWDNAIPAYLHFLTGEGADRTFDMNNYLTHDTNGGIVEQHLLEDVEAASNQVIANIVDSGDFPESGTVSFTITSDPVTTGESQFYPYPSSTDWQRAVGGMQVWTTSEVTVTRQDDGTYRMETETTIHGEDRYNFNPGQAAIDSGEPDSLRGVLEEGGLAQQYDHTGQTDRSNEWVLEY